MSDPTPSLPAPSPTAETATVHPASPLDSSDTVPPVPRAAPAASALAVPGYEILGELGRGGMGVVYKARQFGLNRLCALKMILSGGHASEADLARFRSEAEAVARLQHGNIVAIYEIGTHEGKPFFSLELCGGGSLDRKLGGTPIEPREAARLVRTLAEAMQAAHEAKVVHRDLKPANVLLGADGTPKITDFGLAKKLDEASQTQTGAVMGTPSYMAPEQAEGKKDVGPLADVYALGAILYDCLTGRPPFKAATTFDTILQVVSEEPVPPRSLNAKVPADLETITLKCLQKDAGKRYTSAGALAADLGRYLAGEPVKARPVGAVERAWRWCRRNPAVAGLAAAVVLTLSGGLAVSLWQMGRANREAERAEDKATLANREATAARKAEKDAAENLKIARAEKARAERQRDRAEWMIYAAKLKLAEQAFQEGNMLLALQYLEECQWDRRGWEHRHLWTRFNSHQTFYGHTEAVACVAFSPDGKCVVSGSADKTVKVWDAEEGKQVFSLKGHTDRITGVAISPNGKRIVSGSADQMVRVWDAHSGKEVLVLRGHTRGVTSVAISADGTQIASGAKAWDEKRQAVVTGDVIVWDAETGETKFTLKGPLLDVTCVAFSPDGKHISAGSGSTLEVWDALKGQRALEITGHHSDVLCVAYTPDGKRIVSASKAGDVIVWDAEKGQGIRTFKAHIAPVHSVAISPDGKHIATASGDIVKVWDAAQGQEGLSLRGHTSRVTSLAYSPDGKRLASGSEDMTVIAWDAQNGQEILSLKGHTSEISSVAIHPDGKRIAVGSSADTGIVWDTEKGQEILPLGVRGAFVGSVAFSPDGKRIVSGDGSTEFFAEMKAGQLKVWGVGRGRELFSIKGHAGWVHSVAYSPDGKRIVSGSADKTVKVWEAERGRELLTLEGHALGVTSVAYSADGKRIASGSFDRTLRVWDAQTGDVKLTLGGHTDMVNSVAYSRDGQRIVSGGHDRTVRVWDAATGQLTLTLQGHTDSVRSVAFSPNGTRIVSGSWDKTVKVWAADSGLELFSLKGHSEMVSSVAFSRDGKRIVSGSHDQTVKVWDARLGQNTLYMYGHTDRVATLAFSADGKRLFAWDTQKNVLAWSTRTGQPTEADNPPTMPLPGPAVSPNGFLRAEARGTTVFVTDKRLDNPKANHWPLPDAAERKRYHTEQAALAEKANQHFAAAFHLGRLLLDAPDDADLKRRRDAALKSLAADRPPQPKKE